MHGGKRLLLGGRGMRLRCELPLEIRLISNMSTKFQMSAPFPPSALCAAPHPSLSHWVATPPPGRRGRRFTKGSRIGGGGGTPPLGPRSGKK